MPMPNCRELRRRDGLVYVTGTDAQGRTWWLWVSVSTWDKWKGATSDG